MKVIGITGSFGTGKTFVSGVFRSLGADIIDADRIARQTVRKGTPAYAGIVGVFGRSVLNKAGQINRSRLAMEVFSDRRKLRMLNRIVHPEVIRTIKRRVEKSGKEDILVIDAPLLIEAGLAGMVDTLIVVTASRARQIERCVKKFRITEDDVLKRIESQIPLRKKVKMADFVIRNDGKKSETRRQIKKVWRKI